MKVVIILSNKVNGKAQRTSNSVSSQRNQYVAQFVQGENQTCLFILSATFHYNYICNGDIITLTPAHVNTERNINKHLNVVLMLTWIFAHNSEA